MIDQLTIEKILDAANIVDVVSEFVTLRRRGVNYVGLCPFHNEKTPSFYVSPSKGICKCFSCGKGGNAIHFLWNELFQPRRQELRPEDYDKFSANLGGDDVVISLEDGKLSYSWLSDLEGVIRMANILYKDKLNGNTQLNWDYNSFEKLDDRNKEFPTQMGITLTSTKKEVKLGMKFSYIGAETEWETRTSISNKYREVDIDEMLQRFMAL